MFIAAQIVGPACRFYICAEVCHDNGACTIIMLSAIRRLPGVINLLWQQDMSGLSASHPLAVPKVMYIELMVEASMLSFERCHRGLPCSDYPCRMQASS